ncbi:MAG: OmpA family protein [Polyangiaceae bacterium]
MKRTSYLSILGLGLVAAKVLAGCASAAPPPAVADAEKKLAAAPQGAKLERPELVADAKELVAHAKELAQRGENEKATLYARQAIQKLDMAGAFAERERVEAFVAALEKSKKDKKQEGSAPRVEVAPRTERTESERVRESTVIVVPSPNEPRGGHAAPPVAPAPQPPAAPPPRLDPRDGSLRAAAERKLVELQFKRSEAIGQGKDQACGTVFREYDSILELSQKRFDAQDYERSYEFSLRAEERFRACDARSAKPLASPATEKPAADDGSKKAAASLQKAQVELARAEAVASDDSGTSEGKALLASATAWFDRKSFSQADELAARAFAVLVRVRPKAATASAPQAGKPTAEPGEDACSEAKRLVGEAKEKDKTFAGKRLPEADEKKRKDALSEATEAEKKIEKKACSDALPLARRASETLKKIELPEAPQKKPDLSAKPWESAFAAIQDAEKSRSIAKLRATTDADKTTFARGEEAFKKATAAYEKDALADAEKSAKDAKLFFDGIREKNEPGVVVAAKPEEKKPEEKKPEDKKPEAAQEAKPAEAQSFAEKRVASVKSNEGDPAWRAAYPKVYRVLALRDEAKAISPQETQKLAEADKRVEAARASWRAKRYAEAGAHADAAAVILEPLTRVTADAGSAEELEEARKNADAALRDSGQRSTICEKERCADRDVKKHAAARELHESAKRAYNDKRYKVALDLATRATTAFDEVLAVPLPGAADDKGSLKDAEDAVRDANVAKKVCSTRGCATHDSEGVVRAGETLLSATVACNDKRYGVCRDRAREAEGIYKKALAAVPTFEIPEGVVGLSRSGDMLVPSPPITFTNGTATLDTKSQAMVAAVAKTILENKKTIRRVSLVGYTDNRGWAPQNKKLSADRAAALRNALVTKGVPADLVTSEGRGAENPVADNTTAEGRERNRRVEIHLELLDGVK